MRDEWSEYDGGMSGAVRRGRPPRTSRDAIFDAVLRVGFDQATTSAVAALLGIEQSTLYGHVASREDMLDGATGRALSRIAWPEPGEDWAAYLRDCAEAMWALFAANPGLARRLRAMNTVPDAVVVQSCRVVAYLTVRLGIDVREAALIVDAIADLTVDSYLTVEALDDAADDGRRRRDQVWDAMVAAGEVAADPGIIAEYLEVMRVAMGEPGAPSDWWRHKIDLVIDGVRLRVAGGSR